MVVAIKAPRFITASVIIQANAALTLARARARLLSLMKLYRRALIICEIGNAKSLLTNPRVLFLVTIRFSLPGRLILTPRAGPLVAPRDLLRRLLVRSLCARVARDSGIYVLDRRSEIILLRI